MASNANFVVGARCEIHGEKGVIRFIGSTAFAPGKWVGVELDEPNGKNNGSVAGKQYFECRPNHGVFVRASQLKTILPSDELSNRAQNGSPTPSNREGFAPAHDPSITTARQRLRSPTVLTSSIPGRTSASNLPRTPTKQPSSPTSTRTNFGHARTPSSPAFTKRSRVNSDVGSEIKRPSIEPGVATVEGDGLEETDDVLFEEPFGDDDLEPSTPAVRRETPVQQLEATLVSTPQDSSLYSRDQTVPLKDYEELRLKLKILENKRQEDREKMKESELKRQEAEQFLSVKPKLQAKMAEMQQEARESRKQLKDIQTEKEHFENKYNEAAESMEMMTLDKEMAEEKAENLQHEVNLLKEKIEEISVDLNVFKQESDLLSQAENTGEARSAVEIIQLERQNERLKEALVRLRDVTSEQESELNRKIKTLEKDLSSLQDIQVQYDQMKNHFKTSESQIEDLKARLDDALNAEDMLEELTEKNLALSEQLEEMKIAIEDLEALKALNDELEESHIENEKQLQSELDQKDVQIRDCHKRIEAAEETNADYVNTINQFRELVATLQSDLDQTRQKESQSSNLGSQSQAMLNLNLQLQSTVMKAQAKQIDLELRKLGENQAKDKLAYLEPYLPESFFSTEEKPIECLLLLKRLVFKSELIIKQLDQLHNVPEKLNATVSEKLIAVCEMRQKLAWFSDLSKRLVSFVNECPVETFEKMGQVLGELIGTERRLDAIVELLRKEELKEADCLEDVKRSIAQLEHLAEIYLSSTRIDVPEKFYGFVRAVDLDADTITATLSYIKQTVENAYRDDEINVSDDSGRFSSEFFQPLQTIVTQSKSSKVMARKLIRSLDDMNTRSLTLKSDLLPQFRSCYTSSIKLSNFCQEVWRGISKYINEKKGTKEELQLSGLQQIIYKVTDEILGINEMNMWAGYTKSIQGLCQEISKLNNVSSDNELFETVVKGEMPWVTRSKDLKAKVLINVDTERKLQQSVDENRELIKELKLKEQVVQESQVKIELLESRLETAKKQADMISELEEQLASSKKQQNDFEEAMESLQADIGALEQENKQFKSIAQKLEDQGMSPRLPNKQNPLVNMVEEEENYASQIHEINPIENQRLSSQIESLKFSVRYLRAENAHLKGKDALNILNVHLPPKKKKDINSEEILKSIALEAKSLLKDFRTVSASPRVVDLTKASTNHKGWQPKSKLPNYQYQTQQSVMYTLQQRSNELKAKLMQLDKANKLKPEKSSIAGERPPIGRIQVPLPDNHHSNKGTTKISLRHNIKLKNAADFEKIHSIFVN